MEKELATGNIDELGYDGLTREIRATMRRTAQDAVKLGYMLKRMTMEKLWEQHYDTLDEYLSQELHIDYTLATRFIKIHATYAESEKSISIKEQYGEYSQGALIEMLSMTQEQRAAVTPDMTVKEIRQIKKKEKNVAPSQHSASWFVEKFIEFCPDKAESFMKIIGEKEGLNSDFGKLIQVSVAPYGCSGANLPQISVTFYGFQKGIDIKVDKQSTHMSYTLFAAELVTYMERTGKRAKVVAEGEYREIDNTPAANEEDTKDMPKKSTAQEALPEGPLSAHGLPKSIYPPDSLIATEGCGHKYNCYSCSMECEIRQEERYCVEAPLGNPFSCTVMNTSMIELGLNIGNMCQFVNHKLAMHRAGDGEPVPCCKNCNHAECSYRCERAIFHDEEESIKTAAIREVLNGDTQNHYTSDYTQTKQCFLHDYKDSYIHVCVGDNKYYIDVMDQLDTLLVYENRGTEKSPLLSEHTLYTWSMIQFCIQVSKYVSQREEKSIAKSDDIGFTENETTKQDITPHSVYLEEQKKLIQAQANGADTAFTQKQKIIVRALQDMMASEPVSVSQPVLPEFTSEEHIKKWLSEYQEWGMWYRDEHIDVNYYKFDFADGSRLIVTEYPNRKNHPYNKYLSSGQTEAFYRLLQSADAGRDYQYQERTSAEREIIEYLKRLTGTNSGGTL